MNIMRKHNRQTLVSTSLVIAAYATANPPQLVLPLKDMLTILHVHANVTNGYEVVVTGHVRNVVTVRIYKMQVNYQAPAGGGNVVTCRAAGAGLERAVVGAGHDAGGSTLPVEIPDGAIALTITCVAVGTK